MPLWRINKCFQMSTETGLHLESSSETLVVRRRSGNGNCNVLFVFCFIMAISNFVDRSDALRLTNMSSPMVADLRDNLTLDCQFDMEGEYLYAVKWYKDEHEFFRYRPIQTPSTIVFPVAGVHLKTSESDCGEDHCKIILHDLSRDHSGGAYTCEISSEAPTFSLASKTHNVTIAALPKGNLRIEQLASDYAEGELVNADCISEPADPAPILSWYINGHQAPQKFVGEMASSHPDVQGLLSRSLSLRFVAERKYFLHGEVIELLCRSSLPGIPVAPQTITKIVGLKTQPAPVINNQKLHWSNGTAVACKSSAAFSVMLATAIRWCVSRLQAVR